MDTKPGQYLRRDDRHRLQAVAPGEPDAVICRRVTDYPDGRPPSIALLQPCVECGAVVARNPAGPHADRPPLCMQCYGLAPLPYGD